jgi:hypothetical protein
MIVGEKEVTETSTRAAKEGDMVIVREVQDRNDRPADSFGILSKESGQHIRWHKIGVSVHMDSAARTVCHN